MIPSAQGILANGMKVQTGTIRCHSVFTLILLSSRTPLLVTGLLTGSFFRIVGLLTPNPLDVLIQVVLGIVHVGLESGDIRLYLVHSPWFGLSESGQEPLQQLLAGFRESWGYQVTSAKGLTIVQPSRPAR